MAERKKQKTRKDKGVMVVDKQTRSLLPYFHSTSGKNQAVKDKKLTKRMSIATSQEFAEAMGISKRKFLYLVSELKECADDNERLDLLESELTVKGLKNMLKLVKTRKKQLKDGTAPRKRRAISPQTKSKLENDAKKAKTYAQKTDEIAEEMNAGWGEWKE